MVREEARSLVETHVATVCILEGDDGNRVLLGKRAEWREIFPGYWECGGGQVREDETFEDAVRAHMREEFGLDVDVISPVCTYNIELKDGHLIPGIRFVCKPKSNLQVRIDHVQIVEYDWVKVADLREDLLIPGLTQDVRKADELIKRRSAH